MKTEDVIKNIGDIYSMFEDELSQEIYINRMNWLVTGNYRYIEQIVKKSHPKIPIWNRKSEKDFIDILPQNCKIIFYGAGSFAERLIPYLKETSLEVEFCDSNLEIQNRGFYGYKVISPQSLIEMSGPKYIVICTTKYLEDVEEYLLSNGIERNELIDIRGFFKCGTGDEYFYEEFLEYTNDEVFIDAGCCDLGTTIEFSKLCKGLRKVYAFEPDLINFEKCRSRIEKFGQQLPDIKMLPYGTWSGSIELSFSSTGDGCSHVGEGESIIKTAAIDDVIEENDKVTFIKMDVEGAELESLNGARKIIQRDKPKLAICIYHKPEDILTIPLYIKSLVPDYKYYLRSYSNADNEMVLYAIP